MLMLNPSSASQLVLSPQPLLQNRVRAFVDDACKTHKKSLVWISAIYLKVNPLFWLFDIL